MAKKNLKKVKTIDQLDKSRLALLRKYAKHKALKYFTASCEYTKEIFERDSNYQLKNIYDSK